MAMSVLVLGNALPAHAQAVDITVEPETPAPAATVTVTIAGAAANEPVVVRLGIEQETATTDESGGAIVMIAAPETPGETLGAVQISAVDWPIRVVVQAPAEAAPAKTTTAEAIPAETAPAETAPAETAPAETTTAPLPGTGLDDATSIAGVGAALLAAGAGLVLLTRRPTAAAVFSGTVTHYRFAGRRRSRAARPRTR